MVMIPGDTRTGTAFPAGSIAGNAAVNIKDGCIINPAANMPHGPVLPIWKIRKAVHRSTHRCCPATGFCYHDEQAGLRQQTVLRPLLQSLRGLNDQSRLLKIEELETAIEKNRDQKQVLTNLMASGYLEPALFNKESNELAAEEDILRQEKDGLMRSVNGDMVKIEELQRLLRFVSKGTMLTEFDDKTFLSFAERITILSRKEVVFELKCGLSLRERLVEP